MNLIEAIRYRTRCPICNTGLKLKVEQPGYKVVIKKTSIRLHFGAGHHRYIDFNDDMTFKATSDYDNHPNYISGLIFRRYCKGCVYPHKSLDLDTGVVILKSIKKKAYFYSFNLKIGDGKFEPNLIREGFNQLKDGSYYIIDNNFVMQEMSIQKMKTLNDRIVLQFTSKDLSSYSDAEALRGLVNMYALFS